MITTPLASSWFPSIVHWQKRSVADLRCKTRYCRICSRESGELSWRMPMHFLPRQAVRETAARLRLESRQSCNFKLFQRSEAHECKSRVEEPGIAAGGSV